jgi:DNA-binding transcriptional regulator YiaG
MKRPTKFQAWVRRLRRQLGVSQSGLGRMLGVTKQTVWLWESGRARPRSSHLLMLQRLVPMGQVRP